MQFHRDTDAGLQRILRSGSETWIEHAAQVLFSPLSALPFTHPCTEVLPTNVPKCLQPL